VRLDDRPVKRARYARASGMQTNDLGLLQRRPPQRRPQRRPRPARASASLRQLPQLGDRCIYFFQGDRYVRYKVATVVGAGGSTDVKEFVDVGPARIGQFWTRLHEFFHRDIDAAVNWGNGKAYFFKQDKYVRLDMATDLVDVGPARIADFWTALRPFPFFLRDLDAVVNLGRRQGLLLQEGSVRAH
jgi:hypothetical protein